MPLKLGHKCSEHGPTTNHFHWQKPAWNTTEIPVRLWDPGNWLCNGAAQKDRQTDLYLQFRLVRSYLLCEAAKGCQLVVCQRHRNCLWVPYKKTPNYCSRAAGGAWPAFTMASHSCFNSSVCSVVSGYCFPWPLILHLCSRFRDSTAQSMVSKFSQLPGPVSSARELAGYYHRGGLWFGGVLHSF